MHLEALSSDQIGVLDGVTGLPSVGQFYLAGGTALALRHGHRRSIDFDWFRRDDFDGHALVGELDGAFDAVERLPSGAHTVYLRIHGVTCSFFRLPYPLVRPSEPTRWGFDLASDEDIAAMKLEAIAGRGSRKDFVDMYLLCERGLRLEDVFELFDEKYGAGRAERYHRLRALSYFDDAEAEPMPEMLVDVPWSDVTAFFTRESKRLLAAGIAG